MIQCPMICDMDLGLQCVITGHSGEDSPRTALDSVYVGMTAYVHELQPTIKRAC